MPLAKSFSLCLVAVISSMVLIGCRAPRPSAQKAEILLQTDFSFAGAAAVEGTAKAFRDYAAPDAMALPQGANPVKGKDQIFQSMVADSGRLTWAPRGAGISSSDDLGYTWGEYQYRAAGSDSSSPVRYGKYLTVWKKQPDGTWKFVVDVGNSSPPPK